MDMKRLFLSFILLSMSFIFPSDGGDIDQKGSVAEAALSAAVAFEAATHLPGVVNSEQPFVSEGATESTIKLVFSDKEKDIEDAFKTIDCPQDFAKKFTFLEEAISDDENVVVVNKGDKFIFKTMQKIWMANPDFKGINDLVSDLSVLELLNIVMLADYLCAKDTKLIEYLMKIWVKKYFALNPAGEVSMCVDIMLPTIFDKYVLPHIRKTLNNRGAKLLGEFNDPSVLDVCFSHNGKFVATAHNGGITKLWNLRTGKSRQLDKYYFSAKSVHFSPDDTQLLTCSRADGYAKLWDLTTAGYTSKKLRFSSASFKTVYFFAIFNSDGSVIATSGECPGYIAIWNAKTGKKITEFNVGLGGGVVKFQDDRHLVIRFFRGVTTYFDIVTGRTVGEVTEHGDILPVAGRSIGSNGGYYAIINSANKKVITTLNVKDFSSACFNSDGSKLVIASKLMGAYGFDIPVIDTATGNYDRILRVHNMPINKVCFSSDDSMVATASNDGVVAVMIVNPSAKLPSQDDKMLVAYLSRYCSKMNTNKIRLGENVYIDYLYNKLTEQGKEFLKFSITVKENTSCCVVM